MPRKYEDAIQINQANWRCHGFRIQRLIGPEFRSVYQRSHNRKFVSNHESLGDAVKACRKDVSHQVPTTDSPAELQRCK